MSRIARINVLRWFALATIGASLAGCANMPLNKPSALSPAQHSTVEAP